MASQAFWPSESRMDNSNIVEKIDLKVGEARISLYMK
jgi:hypothetical protein